MVEEDFYQPVDPALEYLADIPTARAVDTSSWYCADGYCPPVIGNILVYRDGNHLSLAYLNSLVPQVWAEIEKFL